MAARNRLIAKTVAHPTRHSASQTRVNALMARRPLPMGEVNSVRCTIVKLVQRSEDLLPEPVGHALQGIGARRRMRAGVSVAAAIG